MNKKGLAETIMWIVALVAISVIMIVFNVFSVFVSPKMSTVQAGNIENAFTEECKLACNTHDVDTYCCKEKEISFTYGDYPITIIKTTCEKSLGYYYKFVYCRTMKCTEGLCANAIQQ
jgi:hypothetical protein